MTQITNNSQPSFQGKLILTRAADQMVNERFSKMPSMLRTKALDGYDKFIRKVINSDFEVNVSKHSDNNLIANVSKQGQKSIIAFAKDENHIFTKIGLKNPVKFMQEAFEKAQKRV